MELIEVRTVEAVAIPYEIYEAVVYAAISAAQWCKTSDVDPYNKRLEEWIILEDPIMYQIFSIDAKYDPDLLEAVLNVRL